MRKRYLLCLAGALILPLSVTFAAEFPSAPPNLKEMEAKGLSRLTTDELKALFPAEIVSKGTKGKQHQSLQPDGTFVRKGFQEAVGKWRIDEKNNAYCKALQKKKGYEENCFAVFRDPDGIHFFDYDIQDGFYAHTWRKAKE